MTGLVVKSSGLWYEVKIQNQTVVARLRGKWKLQTQKLTNPIAVGDWVEIIPNQNAKDEWIINSINPRKNYVIRKSTKKKLLDHIIASNIDQGVLIASLAMPKTSLGFIDRFLVSLESFRIPGVIIFNKKDIYTEKELQQVHLFSEMYKQVGYRVYIISAFTDIDNIKNIFKDRMSLLCGHSGVGKSTILNALIPHAKQVISDISLFSKKGKHTTTFAELFSLDDSSILIDTPGIKEFELTEINKVELSHYFPEMRPLLTECKFHNCLHENEPQCAIREQLGKKITNSRYKSYLSMLYFKNNRY